MHKKVENFCAFCTIVENLVEMWKVVENYVENLWKSGNVENFGEKLKTMWKTKTGRENGRNGGRAQGCEVLLIFLL